MVFTVNINYIHVYTFFPIQTSLVVSCSMLILERQQQPNNVILAATTKKLQTNTDNRNKCHHITVLPLNVEEVQQQDRAL